jgi:hypothetical protein
MNLRKVMQEQTALLLQEMEDDGFTLRHGPVFTNGVKSYIHTPTKPTTWDINNGWCDTWAERVADIVGGEAIWLDEMPGYDFESSHCALLLGEEWYDAECHEGVDDWRKLPIYVNVNKTREEVLRDRGEAS